MKEENKRENIKNELDRASKTLLEADLLFNNNFITFYHQGNSLVLPALHHHGSFHSERQ